MSNKVLATLDPHRCNSSLLLSQGNRVVTTNLNFDGIGASAVANDGTTAAITLGANMNKPPGDVTIPPDSTAVVVRKLTIASGTKLTIGLGAILRID